MIPSRRRIRLPVLASAVALALAAATFAAAPSGAATTVPIHWQVNASTHIRSLNMDVQIPTGTFDGEVDLATGDLTGHLNLPPASKTIRLFGLPLASTTFAMSENGPITGHVDLATMTVTVNSSFNFAITQASASFLPWLNLVGNSCKGKSPINVAMTGPVDLTGASTFSAEYALPKLKNCGLATPLLNAIIPGGGNTFTATFAPAP
ncbi:MAG TPA: hypothetical protein VFN21_01410 [Acidimicrobiales bacterium]|nr:hypothetical protein [Acidimicrobiales bacterium]